MRVVDDRIVLTPEETEALDQAHRIVAARAKQESGDYDDSLLDWSLLGMLRAGNTPEELLEWARTAPFHASKEAYRGYT